MKPQHIMLDLETLGTTPGSSILSIGAVRFSVEEGVTDKFYVTINRHSCKLHGLTEDPRTLEWWSQQTEEARQAAFKEEQALQCALQSFNDFVSSDSYLGTAMWGNGAEFDNALLGKAYEVTGVMQPWRFTGSRCYRTVKNLFPDVWVDPVGTAHNALDDAEYQANHLIAIAKIHGFDLQ